MMKANASPLPRKYKDFVFEKPECCEKGKLKQMQLECRRLKAEGDSINGIKLRFGKTDYEVFVHAFDALLIEDVLYYVDKRQDIYAYVVPQKKFSASREIPERWTCGGMYWHPKEAPKSFGYQVLQDFDGLFRKMPLIGYSFLGLVALNFFFLYRFRRPHPLPIN
ncbi:hypothetical protein [Flavobacterium sp.]|uniref:hypothetical protein n=1 Tax=Flavobacterium sp. TaxID=239 RepID=UPI0039E58538